jgi:isoquinoline 1-oxidoreductase beta subunit
MTHIVNESRRDFLKTSAVIGGGLALEFCIPGSLARAGTGKGSELTAWVVIQPDDTIIIRVARSEMGQGSSTGLPMLVAEELECDWSQVRHAFPSTAEHVRRNRVFVTMATGGSRAIRDSNVYLRKAGATAREMLIGAASQRWGVPASECHAEKSVVTHQPSGRTLRYGELADAASGIAPPADVKLKDPKDWRILGKPTPRFDIPDKVVGKAVYGIDVKLPGMLHAAIVQCPVFGGRARVLDTTAAEKMRGVRKVVDLGDAVAVVADNWWRASEALKALKIEWTDGGHGDVSSASILAFLRTGFTDPRAPVARNDGDVKSAFDTAAKVLEAEYYAPFLNHATMEPMNCTALVKDDRVTVWVPSQNTEASLATAAKAAGVPLENAEAYKTQLGGGFGRRGAFQDYVHQAVSIAKAMPGTPVKLLWSREEDMQHGHYRPVYVARHKAALDADGNLVAWQVRNCGQSILARVRPAAIKKGIDPQGVAGFANMPYAVPNLHVSYAMRNTHVPVGFWRSVAASNNPFFRECFLDELAHAAGKDPYEFRRAMMQHAKAKRDLAVLEAAAQAAEWGKPAPSGIHRGIAVQDSYGSYAAGVVEISLQGDLLRIHRVVIATDPGYVANPDSAQAQIESCVTYALTAAVLGENTIKDGRVEQANFHDYDMLRIRHMPKVVGLLVPSGGFWGGMGEPSMGPVAPALCNAIFAATGRRIRTLPLKNHGFRLA